NLRRAYEMDRLDQSRPQAPNAGVLADFRGRGRGPEQQSLVVERDADQFGNVLDVDEGGRLPDAGAPLHEEIGAAGEDLRTGIRVDELNRLRERLRSFV